MSGTTEMVPLAKKAEGMRAFLSKDSTKATFAMALPRVGITPDRFLRMALTAFNRDPKLYECDPQSVLACLVLAAQSGLSPSGISGECYLVPFRNGKTNKTDAQFIPGYRGLMKVARRSGEVTSIAAECVHKGDTFTYEFGTDGRIRHVPGLGERGEVSHVWALAKLKSGGEQFIVLTIDDVKKVQAQSKASQFGPWKTHWEEMAKKTAIRRLCKYLPLSDDDMRLIELAGKEEAGVPQNIDVSEVIDVQASKPDPKAAGTNGHGDRTDADLEKEAANALGGDEPSDLVFPPD